MRYELKEEICEGAASRGPVDDDGEEVTELYDRIDELESHCQELEEERMLLERQLNAARVLLRKERSNSPALRAYCPNCGHCQSTGAQGLVQ